MSHYRRLVAKGIAPHLAREMAGPPKRWMQYAQATLCYVLVCAIAIALWLGGARWQAAKDWPYIAALAVRIEFLEYVVAACQSKQGGLHVGGVWHRCILREVRK